MIMVDMENPIKLDVDLKDDIRQAFIVAKYETMKFTSGKKILIYGIINVIALVALTAALLLFGDNIDAEDGMGTYISIVGLILLIGATLFSSVTLVSEFEERTSLVLFTKPIRKASIFFGKFLAAFGLNVVFVIAYYLIAMILVLVVTGGFTTNAFISLFYCILYIFSLTGIAMLFSAMMKKASSAAILTFVFILLVPGIISTIILAATVGGVTEETVLDTWYMLDTASNIIVYSLNGTATNELLSCIAMIMWGLVPLILSLHIFRKRQI